MCSNQHARETSESEGVRIEDVLRNLDRVSDDRDRPSPQALEGLERLLRWMAEDVPDDGSDGAAQ
ncbi:hypothetical protein [Streptomyces nanshensis]|uniref:Uncharacterized protein n=1 Tax=Streptomyces nanshensis TaxID=518642 RepID=A0A1E7KZ73_9ACTN|nr:hypothetical protein [Streptomyces nanshensis]OEV09222.1 hypothetical protein AN218_22370 [Streptomyces nanshensis]